MLDWPTISRMALSATSFTVISGFWMLNRYCWASLMRQNTTKSTSTMFSSPVSIRLSSGTSRTPPAKPRAADAGAHADLDDVLPRHLGQAHLLDRVGQAEVQARRLLRDRLAEAHDDAELVGVDAEGEGVEGDDRRHHDRDQEHERARQARAARHHLLELVLAALQQLLEIGLVVRAARGPLAPRTAAAASAADRRHSDCSKAYA